jgi:hypothetical protein
MKQVAGIACSLYSYILYILRSIKCLGYQKFWTDNSNYMKWQWAAWLNYNGLYVVILIALRI